MVGIPVGGCICGKLERLNGLFPATGRLIVLGDLRSDAGFAVRKERSQPFGNAAVPLGATRSRLPSIKRFAEKPVCEDIKRGTGSVRQLILSCRIQQPCAPRQRSILILY